MMRPATIFLGQGGGATGSPRGGGSGEESARASAFFLKQLTAGFSFNS